MAKNRSTSPVQELFTCTPCSTQAMNKPAYISHILGKRHQKNLKNRNQPQPNDETNRTIHVTGFDKKTPVEAIVGVFLKYGVRNASYHHTYSFIEFESADVVKKVLQKTHFHGGNRLQVAARHHKKQNRDQGCNKVPLSLVLSNLLLERVKGQQLDMHIESLIKEIELKPEDYQRREYVRKSMVQFLMSHFAVAFGYVFGSSANTLGFKGCDVDLYVDVGVNPWAPGYSRAESECQASDLTFYLAREIRRSGIGIKVQAVARARVPIVKFEDQSTGLMVDLSFRHGMPVYNTQLIAQYSLTHPLVRPYLMLIRYWAKIQGVAGGGQPSYLITNYALTMLMLFYLMSRDDPIIPSVAYLKQQQGRNYNKVIIGGWDCGFSRTVSEWTRRSHNVTVMELVAEFFTYFEKLEASKWVISPLAGELIEKKFLKDRDMKALPQCQIWYCRQSTDIQMNTALCLQDPFEHSHNCTRGLRDGPLAEFQYKCRKAAEISKSIVKGQQSLSDLFKSIEITPEILKEICSLDSSKEMDQSIDEVITLDDSDDASQDSIEILNVSSEKEDQTNIVSKSQTSNPDTKESIKKDNLSPGEDVIVVISGNSREVITKDIKNGSSSMEISENGVVECKDDCNEVTLILPENAPEKKLYKFHLCYSEIPEFSITFDGAVSGGKGVMTAADDIGQAACSLVHFALQQCLKIDVSVIESFMGSRKRKSITHDDDTDTGKRIKGADGESVPVVTKYHRLAQYQCVAVSQLWIGRKKISKKVPCGKNVTPLQYELAITEVQVSTNDLVVSSDMATNSEKLEFMIELWQKCGEASTILVTGDSRSNPRITRAQMIPMFNYLTSLSQTLLRKVKQFVVTTSSKR